MSNQNPQDHVKSVYPDAFYWALTPKGLIGAIFEGKTSSNKLSGYATERQAWKQASNNLKIKQNDSRTAG